MSDQVHTDPLLPPATPVELQAEPASETAEQRSERMRKLAQRPRTRKPRMGEPKWLQRLEDDIAAAERNPQYVKALREIRAEMKAIEATASETLVKATARQTAVVAYVEAALFSAGLGGGVNKHRKQLHQLTEQRKDQTAALLSLRLRLGLDAETLKRPETFSDAFRAAALHDESDSSDMAARMAEGRRRMAPIECSRAVERENATRARVAEALRAAGLPLTPECEPIAYEPTDDELQFCGEDPGAWDMVIRRKAKPVVEPVALLEGPNPSPTLTEPAPTVPEPSPPDLELEPEPPAPVRPVVEDLGNPRATAAFVREIDQPAREDSGITISTEPRPQILRNARLAPGIWTDDSGFPMPSPWNHR